MTEYRMERLYNFCTNSGFKSRKMARPSPMRNSPPVSAALKHTNAAALGALVPTNSLCIPVLFAIITQE